MMDHGPWKDKHTSTINLGDGVKRLLERSVSIASNVAVVGRCIQGGARAAQIRCGGSNEAMSSRDVDVLLCGVEARLAIVEPRKCSDGGRASDDIDFIEHFDSRYGNDLNEIL